jgi:two-component system response regulator GlrR
VHVHDLATLRGRVLDAGIPLIGESPAFLGLLHSIERVARHGAVTVLIRGETGTGKELIARAIHYLSERRDHSFVPVNCGALPESLAENELFGHRAGAYTGAAHESIGLVRLAHQGTLFLDEVDSLPAKVQVALLRFLQDGRYRPLGAAREEQANVRIIAASNRCLEDEVRAQRFREDLFYRLNLLTLQVPPLRVRSGDVHVLAKHFLGECARRYSMPRKSLHERTRLWFEEYGWPGNVRELENLLHREYLLCDDELLRIAAPAGVDAPAPAPVVDLGHLSYRAAKAHALEEFDRSYLVQLLQRTRGNVTKAAQLAGKERRALGKLLKRYDIAADHRETREST